MPLCGHQFQYAAITQGPGLLCIKGDRTTDPYQREAVMGRSRTVTLLGLTIFCVIATVLPSQRVGAQVKKPNILVIMGDDIESSPRSHAMPVALRQLRYGKDKDTAQISTGPSVRTRTKKANLTGTEPSRLKQTLCTSKCASAPAATV